MFAVVRVTTVVCAALLESPVVEASAGLRGELVRRDVVEQRLRSEFESLLGQGGSHLRLTRLEDGLRPTFEAMPKTAAGGVTVATARYTLQRYFMRQHGWKIQGLSISGSRAPSNESLSFLKQQMPGEVFGMLEQRLAGGSIGLNELAVVAATFEDLVFSHSMDILEEVYSLANSSTGQALADEGFLLFFIAPHFRELAKEETNLEGLLKTAPNFVLGLQELMLWAQDLKKSLAYQQSTQGNPFVTDEALDAGGYSAAGRYVEAVTEQFGRAQDLECKMIKNSLMDLDPSSFDTGRVPLHNFYNAYMKEGHMHFSESKPFLRSIGALDETNPNRPSIIVPNYMNSQSNCVATSGFMSVCCMDHCEPLMTAIEEQIAAPLAAPERVLGIVAGLSTETSAARALPEEMADRLYEIALKHDGQVPLQGRMFAQWMHRAFPNECPLPVARGSDDTNAVEETESEVLPWLTPVAEEHEMKEVIEAATHWNNSTNGETGEGKGEWLQEEHDELLAQLGILRMRDQHTDTMTQGSIVASGLRLLAMGCAVASSAFLAFGKLRGEKKNRGLLPQFTQVSKMHLV